MAQTTFDSLWNFNSPAETEQKFRAMLPEIIQPDQHLQLMTQIARAQGLQRKFEAAHQTLEDVEKQLTPQTPIAHIRYLLERGRAFNSAKMKLEALPLFVKAYETAIEQNEDNLAVDAAHMVAIAETRPEKQMEWNLIAVQIAEKSADTRAQNWLGSLYNNIGWTYHDQNNHLAALEIFKKALAFREKQNNPETIRIAKWCVARTYRALDRLQEALTLQLQLADELDSVPNKDGFVYEELGELYLLLTQPALSKKYFSLAFDLLSQDEWFKTNNNIRLERIFRLKQ